jgi:hypothetical protein
MKNDSNSKTRISRMDPTQLNGIYKGVIRYNVDQSRTGMLKVHIPSLGLSDTKLNWFDCFWTSPFAGSTDPAEVSRDPDDLGKYEKSQKSYGLWMIPPDINNQVLVAFGDGIGKFGYVISCLFSDRMNYMVPGMPNGRNYGDPALRMPVAEKNPYDSRTTNNDVERPVHVDIAEAIVKQGLINDTIRGVGTSGARRESPSEVFGILTPGPRGNNPKRSRKENYNHRRGGHQFIMDDNPNHRMIRLRTALGNQLLLDDTTGTIYMINKKGNAWFELGSDGDVNIYSEGSINMRAKKNLNIRADQDINIEAGQDLKLKAAGDNIAGAYTGIPLLGAFGIPPLGTGGSVRIEAGRDLTQYAAQNVQTTAAGGDIDLSAGGRVALTASSPVGIDILAATGKIKLQSTLTTSVLATAGFNVTSGAPVGITAPLILLNSGGTPALPAIPAVPAPQIGTNRQKDAPVDPPFFDREAALQGQSATRGGRREGREDRISTIVPVLLTAEPFLGHGQFDPADDFSGRTLFSEDIANAIPPGGLEPGSVVPADAVTPAGFQQGKNYIDQAGNALTDAGAAISGNPTYNELKNIQSQFQAVQDIFGLLSLENFGAFITGIQSVIPPIRFPTTTALSGKIIGLGTLISEQAARLQQFIIDATGKFLEFQSLVAQQLQSVIQQVGQLAADSTDYVAKLAERGISVIQDGASRIFQDALGNKLVDFSNGIGPVGASLGAIASIQETFDSVKSSIVVPLTQNQTLSIASFAQGVGPETFRSSNVLSALNEGKYSEVPRLMNGWVLGSSEPGGANVVQPSMVEKRLFETSLFQTPDGVSIGPGSGVAAGELSFGQLADRIDLNRLEFIEAVS